MAYTADEQARISLDYPEIQWINGMPYTTAAPEGNGDGVGPDYLGANAPPVDTEGQGTTLYPANLRTHFPWEFLALQGAAPALVAGGGAALGGGGGASGAGATYGGLPLTSALPAGAGPSIAAPAVGAGAAGGGGGLWSTLTSGAGSGALSAAGDFLTGVTQGMTANRTEADNRALTQDQMRLSSAAMETSTEAQRAQLQMQQQEAQRREQADAYRKVLLGQMAQKMGDVSLDRSGFQSDVPAISFSGGLRPSVIGQAGREAGGVLSQQAGETLRTPSTYEPLPTYAAPALSEPSSASLWERLLSPIAGGATALGNMNRVVPTTQAPPPQRVG